MRELFATIRAAIEAAPYYLQAKLDHWSARLDPHLGEWPGDGVVETGGAELAEVEKFLDDVRSVESVLRLRHDEITAYLEGTLGIDLDQWQRNLIGVVYGPQAPVEVEK